MNLDLLISLALPVGIGVVIIVALFFLRRLLYSVIHKLTARTRTCFDDILVHETRIATLLWCFWPGIYVGYKIAVTPEAWIETETKIISTLFVALGIYTAITVVMAIFKWYKNEICPKTNSSLWIRAAATGRAVHRRLPHAKTQPYHPDNRSYTGRLRSCCQTDWFVSVNWLLCERGGLRPAGVWRCISLNNQMHL